MVQVQVWATCCPLPSAPGLRLVALGETQLFWPRGASPQPDPMGFGPEGGAHWPFQESSREPSICPGNRRPQQGHLAGRPGMFSKCCVSWSTGGDRSWGLPACADTQRSQGGCGSGVNARGLDPGGSNHTPSPHERAVCISGALLARPAEVPPGGRVCPSPPTPTKPGQILL